MGSSHDFFLQTRYFFSLVVTFLLPENHNVFVTSFVVAYDKTEVTLPILPAIFIAFIFQILVNMNSFYLQEMHKAFVDFPLIIDFFGTGVGGLPVLTISILNFFDPVSW